MICWIKWSAILKEFDLAEIICSAIYRHDDKQLIDGPMDEVLKDADAMHHCMNDISKAVKEKEKKRYENLCGEFGLG